MTDHSSGYGLDETALRREILRLQQEVERLAATRTPGGAGDEIDRLRAQVAQLGSQNERLAGTLRDAREQIIQLKAEVDRLAQPPNTFGVYFGPSEEGTVEVISAGRKMRVAVSPSIDLDELAPGQEVMLNEAFNVVAVRDFEKVGEIVILKELMDGGDRALVTAHADEERVVHLAGTLREEKLKIGDALTMDSRAGFVFEKVPRAEVEELVLEEVPDIDYTDIGGLGPQIAAIRDAVELPFLHPELYREHGLKATQGRAALRPARLRQDADRQGGRPIPGQEGGRGQGPEGLEELLPQHQGPGAAEQVRRRDRAAHPADLPAGPREGQRRHAGGGVLRRDGLRSSAPAGPASPATSRPRSCRSC